MKNKIIAGIIIVALIAGGLWYINSEYFVIGTTKTMTGTLESVTYDGTLVGITMKGGVVFVLDGEQQTLSALESDKTEMEAFIGERVTISYHSPIGNYISIRLAEWYEW